MAKPGMQTWLPSSRECFSLSQRTKLCDQKFLTKKKEKKN